ncbi:DNA polymerase [Nymphaea thermarum]|nr:DNA polymerase [Nymphaea thermarum]
MKVPEWRVIPLQWGLAASLFLVEREIERELKPVVMKRWRCVRTKRAAAARGEFGMNPESTVTEICNHKKYEELMKMDNFQSAEKLTDHYYMVNYISNSSFADDDDWKAPKMSAVQLAAAITACARIHMYPYISRPDCYYTDTDSIVLGSPLPDDLISSIELDLSLTGQIPTVANFRIEWNKLQIGKKEILIKLRLPQSHKRKNVYDSNNVWIDTRPIDVIDIGSLDANTILQYELLKKNEESVSQFTTEGQKTTTLQPTLYKTKGQAKKAKAKKDNENSSPYRPKPDE